MKETKTNYKILLCSCIINVFMALSLNNFVSSDVFLPALFLYFISNFMTFFEKSYNYKFIASKYEKYVSYTCCIVCGGISCLYTAHALQMVEIVFFKVEDNYRILLQGMPNTFLSFKSVDITGIIIICILFIPLASVLLCIIPFLHEQGFSKQDIENILKKHKCILVESIGMAGIAGGGGVIYCYIKSVNEHSIYGVPQYWKYFTVCFIVIFLFSLFIIIKRYKRGI